MATASDNQADMDLFYKTHQEPNETAAPVIRNAEQACIAKLIHPPSAIPSFDGLPTLDARSQVVSKYVNVGIIAQPSVELDGKVTAVPPDYLSNFAILCPTGARVDAICFAINPGAQYPSGYMTQDLSNVITNEAYNFSNWYEDANLYRPIGKSLTTYLNATAFNDTGIVSGEQFNPNILFAGKLLGMALEDPVHFYEFVDSMNRRGTLSYPRGFDIVDNPFDSFPIYIQDEIRRRTRIKGPINLDPNTSIQVINMGEIGGTGIFPNFIPSPNQIMNQSARAYTGKAREGTFSVQRLNTVAPKWLSSSNTSSDTIPPPLPGLYDCYYYTVDTLGNGHYVPFAEKTPNGTPSQEVKVLRDTLWSSDMTWSITFYQGLTATNGLTQQSNMVAYKFYTIFEIQPAPRSAWAGLMKLAPKPSLKTMEDLLVAFYDLKDMMPAAMNFNFYELGSKFAGDGLKVIMDGIFGKKEAQPLDKKVDEVAKDVEKLAIDEKKVERASVTTKNNPKYRGPPARFNAPRQQWQPRYQQRAPPRRQRRRSYSASRAPPQRRQSRNRALPANRRRTPSRGRSSSQRR